jgi:hypothetical protein
MRSHDIALLVAGADVVIHPFAPVHVLAARVMDVGATPHKKAELCCTLSSDYTPDDCYFKQESHTPLQDKYNL